LARCELELDNPKFVQSIGGDADGNLLKGLKELNSKIANNHRLSGWFNHPMPGYPQYQNKIWKWDFAPEGDSSSTRKGWRLFAYVEHPDGPEPISAVPFLVYEKPGPKGNPAKHAADALKAFLRITVRHKVEEAKCRRQYDGDNIILLCNTCFEVLIVSADVQEVDIIEDTHECPAQVTQQISN
jgi:hypothetical protein